MVLARFYSPSGSFENQAAIVFLALAQHQAVGADLRRVDAAVSYTHLDVYKRQEEILSLEPNVNPGVVCAVLAPTSGITSPYELTCALADHAAVNGVDLSLIHISFVLLRFID